MKRTILALAAALCGPALLFPGEPRAQSFDCEKAVTADEKAVCDSGTLSALDDEMAALYRDIESRALMGTNAVVREDQRAFLTERRECGARTACLERLYRSRIASLTATKQSIGQGAR